MHDVPYAASFASSALFQHVPPMVAGESEHHQYRPPPHVGGRNSVDAADALRKKPPRSFLLANCTRAVTPIVDLLPEAVTVTAFTRP